MKVGLRVDVDTLRGTRLGVPNLYRLLAKTGIKASFFFSVGPDNMGRHLFRLLRPAFFAKMIRSKAPSLYGWDIVLRGTVAPGPVIGERLSSIIRWAVAEGHEAGLHAWDHYQWQTHIEAMGERTIDATLQKGWDLLTHILGHPPTCSAAPAWRCPPRVLRTKERFPFLYNSDCRGVSPFFPLVNGIPMKQPQIPVTLPTYDEVIGREGVMSSTYNDFLLSRIRPGEFHVLTIHAEVEGMACLSLFQEFLQKARSLGIHFVRLGDLLRDFPPASYGTLIQKEIMGREGWASCQAPYEVPIS